MKLTQWGWVTHICVSEIIIIGSDNGFSPDRRQAIIWTNAGILLIGPWGTNSNEIVIKIQQFSFKKMHLNMSSGNSVNSAISVSNNGLLVVWHQAIGCTSAGLFSIGHLERSFSEIWFNIRQHSIKKLDLKISFSKWQLHFVSTSMGGGWVCGLTQLYHMVSVIHSASWTLKI